jgi:hypothetical protein
MRYVRARIGEFRRDLTCRIYYADMLRVLTEAVAKIGGGDFAITPLAEILYPKPVDNRTEEEVIAHIRSKLRGDTEP